MLGFMHQFWNTLHQRSAPTECEICCEAFPTFDGDENTVSCSRGHTFCISCFRAYAKEAIYGMSKVCFSSNFPFGMAVG